MKRIVAFTSLLASVAGLPAMGQDSPAGKPDAKVAKPASAQSLLDGALKKAKARKIPVFVVFDASW